MELAAHRAADDANQRFRAHGGHVGNGVDAAVAEFGRGDCADAPQPLDGKGVEEVEFAIRLHHEQPVWLADGARHLGQELGAGNADRDG